MNNRQFNAQQPEQEPGMVSIAPPSYTQQQKERSDAYRDVEQGYASPPQVYGNHQQQQQQQQHQPQNPSVLIVASAPPRQPDTVVIVEKREDDDPTCLWVSCLVASFLCWPATLCIGIYGLAGHHAKHSQKIKSAAWANIATFATILLFIIILVAALRN
uniref:Uncharacterized protein n=1 Tax=Chromera velia CCMP2878 TaxID=1169474 RepID=A0A0G4HWN6_9ALVE|eukprot:Cvel_9084.t1-p1 / transcript=Cvel_9084.t1 / gene=Cvel_9084 / organism=Chromera_velia_CCMP2878 / gene_product=hypothetical protein / transcript_product=hypothetical protein / location=Cvel_scaffold515:66196-67810(-) / protein_length=158 / sequence_SO=supercontig / SO=protein_coding / is_pseudo=false